jgi:hypothetical protein
VVGGVDGVWEPAVFLSLTHTLSHSLSHTLSLSLAHTLSLSLLLSLSLSRVPLKQEDDEDVIGGVDGVWEPAVFFSRAVPFLLLNFVTVRIQLTNPHPSRYKPCRSRPLPGTHPARVS